MTDASRSGITLVIKLLRRLIRSELLLLILAALARLPAKFWLQISRNGSAHREWSVVNLHRGRGLPADMKRRYLTRLYLKYCTPQ
ncbi:hypothetical protein EDB19DRAFT_64060 [Suillus lakei]|nr:hypothetical protein EDB19DRAFT_64060 [Suillus lakei]